MSEPVCTAFLSSPPTCSTAYSSPAPCHVTDSSRFPPEFQPCVPPPTFSQCLSLKYLKVNMPTAKFTTVFPEAVLVLSQWHGHLSRWARERATAPFLTPATGRGREFCLRTHTEHLSPQWWSPQRPFPVDGFLVSLSPATLTL